MPRLAPGKTKWSGVKVSRRASSGSSSGSDGSAAIAGAAGVGANWGLALSSTGIFGAINLLGLAISLGTGSHVHLDLLGTGAFAAVAWATQGPDLRSQLSAGVVGLWAVRLAAFLFFRALQLGHDARLDETLASTGGAIGFWGASFLWGVITALPHTLGSGCGQRPQLGAGAVFALVLCAAGLYWEWAGDAQKWLFKADPTNRGKFCDVGVWSMSQHPNYFGNLLIWTGVFLLNAAPLAEAGKIYLLLGSLSPLFLGALFYGQASGAITNSVALAAEKYSGDPAYAEYLENVPLIVPKFF